MSAFIRFGTDAPGRGGDARVVISQCDPEEAVGGEVTGARGSVGAEFALDSTQAHLDLLIRRATAILAQLLTADVNPADSTMFSPT